MTLTAAEVVAFPDVSVARAVSVWVPFVVAVVSHETEYGEVVSGAPRALPSRRNCTLATATLSLAFAVTVREPETVAPPAGAVMETVGGVVSPLAEAERNATSCMTHALPFCRAVPA